MERAGQKCKELENSMMLGITVIEIPGILVATGVVTEIVKMA